MNKFAFYGYISTYLICVVLAFLFPFLEKYFNFSVLNMLNEKPIFFEIVFLGPLVETFIFQMLIIESLKHFGVNLKISIFFSSLLFGLFHSHSFFYFVNASIGGFLFSYQYCKFKTIELRFWFTFILHSSVNLTIYTINKII